MNEAKQRVWLITGTSTGLGRALAEVLLEKGERVIASARKIEDVVELEKRYPDRAQAVKLDVTDPASIQQAVAAGIKKFGGLDVLVNNAGYGLEGAIEEVSLEEVRAQFEVNVFGAISVIQAVLPHMRERRAGHIVNISSMGGLTAFPAVGIYNGSKFALEGISEALEKELKHLNIKVTVVEPGSFRTNWAGRSMVHVKRTIPDYEETAGGFRLSLAERNGRQAGDPTKAAEAILGAVRAEEPPLHLLLGPDALRLVGQKLGALQTEILKWASVSAGTNFVAT